MHAAKPCDVSKIKARSASLFRGMLDGLGLLEFEWALLTVTGLSPCPTEFALHVEEDDLKDMLLPQFGMKAPQLRKLWMELRRLKPSMQDPAFRSPALSAPAASGSRHAETQNPKGPLASRSQPPDIGVSASGGAVQPQVHAPGACSQMRGTSGNMVWNKWTEARAKALRNNAELRQLRLRLSAIRDARRSSQRSSAAGEACENYSNRSRSRSRERSCGSCSASGSDRECIDDGSQPNSSSSSRSSRSQSRSPEAARRSLSRESREATSSMPRGSQPLDATIKEDVDMSPRIRTRSPVTRRLAPRGSSHGTDGRAEAGEIDEDDDAPTEFRERSPATTASMPRGSSPRAESPVGTRECKEEMNEEVADEVKMVEEMPQELQLQQPEASREPSKEAERPSQPEHRAASTKFQEAVGARATAATVDESPQREQGAVAKRKSPKLSDAKRQAILAAAAAKKAQSS
eukprot:gnl/TRDRNA2_/TRDRNA2_166108_c0_seq1.p1 gnl/TRDRNA2_/TRDRNA2_166108_c0~~gnl/TRDRNA2_/TRDRNA2_166108_c0_seq1.p1  ORF type:complete len:462 (+),score=87.22 gnl/TRDRNA2_/TRDRNA2_166108_c0_seq1:102-1487(+)